MNSTPTGPEFVRPVVGAGGLRLDPESRSSAIGRTIAYFVGAFLLCLGTGLSMVFVEPVLVGGAVLGILVVVSVLKWPFLGLMGYLIIYQTRIAEIYPQLAPLRAELLIGVLTLASLFLAHMNMHGRLMFDRSRQSRRFLLIIAAALASLPLSYWKLGTWNATIDFVRILVFYSFIVHILDTRAKLRTFVHVYSLLITFVAYQAMKAYLSGSLLFAQGIERAVGTTSAADGPNELGATMATTIPLFLLLAFHKPLGWKRVFYFLMLALALYTMVSTGSRSAVIGFLGGLSYFWWHSKHKVVWAAVGIVLLAGGFLALPAQYQGRYSTITQGELDGSSQERVKVWTKGLKMVADRPLTGIGLNCFATANAYGYSSGPRASWLESHSLYIQVAAEIGLFGFYAVFSFILEGLRLNRRVARALLEDPKDWAFEQALITAIFAGTICLLFTGIFGHSLMRRTWYVYAALGLATLRLYIRAHPELTRGRIDVLLGNGRVPAAEPGR